MLRVNHTVVSMTLFSISSLLALGFLFGNVTNSTDYTYLNDKLVWFSAFAAYGSIKFLQSLSRTPLCLRVGNSIIGLWLWCYIFVSFIVLDPTPMMPIEPILVLPIVWELAYITALIYIYRRLKTHIRRRSDD